MIRPINSKFKYRLETYSELLLTAAKISLKSMAKNKSRTALTILGIMIGIASIIVVYSAGAGIRGLLVDQLNSFGTNIVEAETKVPTAKKGTAGDTQSAMAQAGGVQITTMNLKDMADIKKLDNVSDAYSGILGQEKVTYGNESKKSFLFGTNSSYVTIDNSVLASGNFFTDDDDQGLAQVAVLGSGIKEKLFGSDEAVGKMISIRQSKFRVIGVMKSKGATFGLSFDDYVYVPIRTLQKKIMGIDHVMYIIAQLKDPSQALTTAEDVKLVLRQNHDITNPDKDDFRVSTMEEMMKTLNTATDALTYLLLAIVIISLLVGGVGILNIMYVIVSERTMEIGLRKAVGANYHNIMFQFLVEAILITTLGAIVGIVVGLLFSALIYLGANAFGISWRFIVPLKAFIVSLVFAFGFGIFFGVYPARRAARMDPIEALRRE